MLISRPSAWEGLKSQGCDFSEPQKDQAAKALIEQANSYLETKPLSVTTKSKAPPGGTLHDYISLGRYWWPNENIADGLPYVRRDGEVNPEIYEYKDFVYLTKMVERVVPLAKAYWLTQDERYAEWIVAQIRTWFIDESTRMNPNLNYAQCVPGVSDGRCYGIIEALPLTLLLDYVQLIQHSAHWTDDDNTALNGWFSDYLDWFLTSENGKEEKAQINNHGTYYDMQVAHYMLHLGRTEEVKSFLEASRNRRIAEQIEPDGSQPHELKRTLSFAYVTYNLNALARLARYGEQVGVDFWNYVAPNQVSMLKAMDWLLPYLEKPDTWLNHATDLKPPKPENALRILQSLWESTQNRKYLDVWSAIKGQQATSIDPELEWLLDNSVVDEA